MGAQAQGSGGLGSEVRPGHDGAATAADDEVAAHRLVVDDLVVERRAPVLGQYSP